MRKLRDKEIRYLIQDQSVETSATVGMRPCPPWHLPSLVAPLQQLGGADIPKGDPGYPPHVYAEQGKCERVETRSSLAFSERDLSSDLLDSLGPKAAPPEEIYSESGFRFLKTAYYDELE